MKRLGIIAYGVSLACLTLISADYTITSTILLYQDARSCTALAVAGWLVATLGPVSLSLFVWLGAQRAKLHWLPHLLFIPAAIAVYRGGSTLFFHEVNGLSDSMRDGFALLTAIVYLELALVVHLVAAIVLGGNAFKRWANDS